MQIAAFLNQAREILTKAGVETAALDSRVLLCHGLSLSVEDVIAHPEKKIDEAQLKQLLAFIERRAKREPVSHIIGSREFYSMEFKVTSAVLDPRPDSETLIEAVRGAFKETGAPLQMLDLGTGSGCLLLTLLKLFSNAKGVGVDISTEALTVAKENAARLGVEGRVSFQQGSWLEKVEGLFDIILSNPPYIPNADIETLAPEVKFYEPKGALVGGKDGLDCYRVIIPESVSYLKPDGFLVVECGQGQAEEIQRMMDAEGFQQTAIKKDLAGIGRVVSGRKVPLSR